MSKVETFRFSEDLSKKLEELAKTGQYPSKASIVSKALEQFFDALSKTETTEKPLNLEIVLQAVLGDELFDRHLDFLKTRQKKEEPLEDVFKSFIESAGVQPTKEEFFDRIKEGAKADRFKILQPEACHYRIVDPKTEKWFCDGKEINPAVCIGRQERYAFMRQAKNNPKIKCRPKDMTKSRPTGKPLQIIQRSATSPSPAEDPRPKFMQDRNLIYCPLKGCNRNRSELVYEECKACPNRQCLGHA